VVVRCRFKAVVSSNLISAAMMQRLSGTSRPIMSPSGHSVKTHYDPLRTLLANRTLPCGGSAGAHENRSRASADASALSARILFCRQTSAPWVCLHYAIGYVVRRSYQPLTVEAARCYDLVPWAIRHFGSIEEPPGRESVILHAEKIPDGRRYVEPSLHVVGIARIRC
jgi:hypothetical protein